MRREGVVGPTPGLPPRVEKTSATKDPASGALLLAALGLFSLGTLAAVGLVIGVRALVLALRRPAAAGRKGTALVAIVANLSVLYVSFIAVRGLLRAHVSAAEATAIGDIRTMISAQAAYASQNDGRYEPRLECLLEPAKCLPGYASDAPPFLDQALASLRTKAGYRRAFHPGPEGAPRAGLAGHSRNPGVTSFAYTAVPEVPGETGVRGFCGDSTALICFTGDGREPTVSPDGRCDLTTCRELK
jgi:hypothetical protein